MENKCTDSHTPICKTKSYNNNNDNNKNNKNNCTEERSTNGLLQSKSRGACFLRRVKSECSLLKAKSYNLKCKIIFCQLSL